MAFSSRMAGHQQGRWTRMIQCSPGSQRTQKAFPPATRESEDDGESGKMSKTKQQLNLPPLLWKQCWEGKQRNWNKRKEGQPWIKNKSGTFVFLFMQMSTRDNMFWALLVLKDNSLLSNENELENTVDIDCRRIQMATCVTLPESTKYRALGRPAPELRPFLFEYS